MRILLLAHSFNSLTQRLFVELRAKGHEVSVEFDINADVTEEAVRLAEPDLVVAPFLKRMIPETVWKQVTCLVVHPGIPGDGGPSALDWAILNGETRWGVTVLEANGDFDAGPVWAYETFAMRSAAKASIYRHEVTEHAVKAVHACVAHYAADGGRPESPLTTSGMGGAQPGSWRPAMRAQDRAIDFATMTTADVMKRLRCADGMPGAAGLIGGTSYVLFDGHVAQGLSGRPGTLVARCGSDVCMATTDGAVWIGHARGIEAGSVKLPAAAVIALPPGAAVLETGDPRSVRRVSFERDGDVGVLHFAFYNGAMGVADCKALLAGFEDAARSGIKVLVLAGGPDHWSNGMNLNIIEASAQPAEESWANINAIDDVAEAIIRASHLFTIAALGSNAGAGGVFLARAADRVWMRQGVILNPHYKDMGNLHGSEFWTYLLPRCCGPANARRIMAERLPMGAAGAKDVGLADEVLDASAADFLAGVLARAKGLAASAMFEQLIEAKHAARARDEAAKPLQSWRAEELAGMRRSFFGADPSYHVARHNFVRKVPKARTPLTIAGHRSLRRKNLRSGIS